MILQIRKSKEFIKILLELTNEFSKVAGDYIDTRSIYRKIQSTYL
jgi:hypothetical protein